MYGVYVLIYKIIIIIIIIIMIQRKEITPNLGVPNETQILQLI